MKIRALVKQNSLFISMAMGALVYEMFAHIPCLNQVSHTMGPILTNWLPVGLFLLLYATFCKIKISEMKPRAWHFAIQLVRTSLAAFMVLLISLFDDNADVKLILEGMFICFICPTAAAVVVVTEKLGGSIGSLTNRPSSVCSAVTAATVRPLRSSWGETAVSRREKPSAIVPLSPRIAVSSATASPASSFFKIS